MMSTDVLAPASAAARRIARQAGPSVRVPVLSAAVVAVSLLIGGLNAAQAGIQFNNCVTSSDGSITCDTVPTGNTAMNDVDARYGLLQQASPGWAEFNPYEGYGEDFGDGEF